MSHPTALHEQILAEESELRFTSFTRRHAWELGCLLRDAAQDRSLPMAIGIMLGEQRAFHTALDGSSADNDAWLARKMAVVRRYGRSSLGVGEQFRVGGRDFDTDSRLDTDRFAAHGGAFPLTLAGGEIVGVVGVSGLPQREDHAFLVEQLRVYLGR
ncbi:heme-degrading domain-containing protein [Georgenia muralis]